MKQGGTLGVMSTSFDAPLALDVRELPQLLTSDAAADLLHLSRDHVRRLVRAGGIRGLRPVARGAGRILIPRDAVLEFLSRR